MNNYRESLSESYIDQPTKSDNCPFGLERMSVRTVQVTPEIGKKMSIDPTVLDASGMVDLGEGATGFPTQDPNNPLVRKVDAYVRANLAELSNNPNASVWKLSESQLDGVFKHVRFVDLNGSTTPRGDLQSTVLHSVDATAVKSTFPIQIGIKVTGVDNSAFSSVGTPYSMIAMSEASSNIPIELQREDVTVAYDFARRYPVRANKDSNSSAALSAIPPFKTCRSVQKLIRN